MEDRTQYFKEWREKNRERIHLQKQAYYLKNKKRIDVRNAEYALKNRGKEYERQRRWREQKRLRNLSIRPRRKHLKENEFLLYRDRYGDLREQAIKRDKGKCVDCGMTRKEHVRFFGVDITVDHKDGEGYNSKNPNNVLENLATRCLRCHGRKDQKRMGKVN